MFGKCTTEGTAGAFPFENSSCLTYFVYNNGVQDTEWFLISGELITAQPCTKRKNAVHTKGFQIHHVSIPKCLAATVLRMLVSQCFGINLIVKWPQPEPLHMDHNTNYPLQSSNHSLFAVFFCLFACQFLHNAATLNLIFLLCKKHCACWMPAGTTVKLRPYCVCSTLH